MIHSLIDFVLNIDTHLGSIISDYGTLTYLILFGVIFIETGVVILPFLPGDSLIFAAGAFAALKSLNIYIVFLVCLAAAVIGDTVNFHIGKLLKDKNLEHSKLIKQEYLKKTEHFFERHGGKSIVIARFVPIIRTFAPFVAGIGSMKYNRFITYNFVGGLLWVTAFTLIGYFFGNLPFVSEHFSLIVIGIILVSALPVVITVIKTFIENKKNK